MENLPPIPKGTFINLKYAVLIDFRPESSLVFYTTVPLNFPYPPPNNNVYWKSDDMPSGVGPFPSLSDAFYNHRDYTKLKREYEAKPLCDIIPVDFLNKRRL